MKKKSTVLVALAAALAAGATLAAGAPGVDGKWVGNVGGSEISFTFKADGEKLTGTLENAAAPGATEIKEGTIKGDQISFHVVRTLNNTETKVPWTGKLTGDELKLQRGAAGGSEVAEVVAKRATP